ncbi:MAG: cytochrome c biogenesis protein ResB [Carboxydocellales bacterium]
MRLFQSKKLAIGLIIALTLASLVGVIIPQEVQGNQGYNVWAAKYQLLIPVVKFLGLNQVFHTKWFLFLGIIFFINLTSCTLGQINRVSKLWRTFRQNQPTIPKWFWGVFGNSILHIGLTIVVLGGLVSFGYKMSGYVEVTEGETFTEGHQKYGTISEGPFFNEQHLGFNLTVDKVKSIYSSSGQLDYAISQFTITDSNRESFSATAERGQPFSYRGTTFYYNKSGFAPFITIHNPLGQPVLEGYALFSSKWRNNSGEYQMDLTLPGTDLVLKAQFYPDAIVRDGHISSKTMQLANPLIQAIVIEKEKQIDKLELRPNQAAMFNGWMLEMGDVRFWTGFEVVRDPGAPVIFTGFIISLLGLIVSFLFKLHKPGKEQEDGC